MNTTAHMEEKFARINRIFIPFYLFLSIAAAVYYGVHQDGYHLGTSLGTLALPVGLAVFYPLFKLKSVHQLNFLVLAFSMLGHTLGSALEFYQLIPYFDKFVHMLSGVFVSVLCLGLYLCIRADAPLTRNERLLAILFVFLGSMAVAGLWEISEYAVHAVTGRDVQKVAATGINDTMQDMIVCLVGTLLYLPAVSALFKGKHNFLTGAAVAFVEKNGARLGRKYTTNESAAKDAADAV